MSFHICITAVAPIRSEPSQASEMISSLVYGEKCELLEVSNIFFAKVVTQYDRYEGYVALNQLSKIADNYYNAVSPIITTSYGLLKQFTAPIALPIGCILTEGEAKQFSGTYKHKVETGDFVSSIEQTARAFLNAPYLWGGKTSFGVDCSGFTQTIFKSVNVFMPRDSGEQVKMGTPVDFIEEAKTGDIAFFDNNEGVITHVGILLNKETIIHAAGYVKIDIFDNAGIINSISKERTHQLRIIKRFL
jgi:gamma-D-glutamyl-L-lysine dipeptidyl-peptidase